jgi:hypothetical protein
VNKAVEVFTQIAIYLMMAQFLALPAIGALWLWNYIFWKALDIFKVDWLFVQFQFQRLKEKRIDDDATD